MNQPLLTAAGRRLPGAGSPVERRAANAGVIRSINRSAVLDLIRLQSPISRSEIARQLGLSAPTLTRIVEALVVEDLVVMVGKAESSGGRPSALLAFNGAAHAAVGIDLGGTKMFGAVSDLTGSVAHEIYARHGTRGEAAIEELCTLVESLLRQPRPAGQSIRGIGVGAPGLTFSREGIVAFAPALDWHDVPLKRILSQRFNLPVFVENDVNLAALGEMGFGAGRGSRDLVCIAIGTGIGAGVIVDGALYRGHHHAAGEIGYLVPGVEFLDQQAERFGVFETLASGTAIGKRARRSLVRPGSLAAADGPDGEGRAGTAGERDAAAVFAAARGGEPWARKIVGEIVDLLSVAISGIASLLDPEVIVLGGGVAGSADMMIEPILARLQGKLLFMPRLAVSTLGYRAAVMGAVQLVLDGTTDRVPF
jgi:glucokinase-like ROK family protein